MFQRYSFENLPPERKIELIEKQRKQQQQREILQQQIEMRKKEKDLEREKEVRREYYQANNSNNARQQPTQISPKSTGQNQFQQNISQAQPITIDFSKTNASTPINFRKPNLVFTPQNYSLLPDRMPNRLLNAPNRDRQLVTMSLTPNSIHDAFASLRHQIMATAASSVIGCSSEPRSFRDKKIAETF